ncbi:MAG TPA: rhodanese-like domain-containing protein [Blastocatellia bacterium]|nr:rhodanese-like domain-containing protein [Blastocatellia bacterium]
MTKTLADKFEALANIAIILVALVLGFVLLSNYFRPEPVGSKVKLDIGVKLNLPDVDWSKNDRTFLLAMSEGCQACTDSLPFYRAFSKEVAIQGTSRFMALLPETAAETEKFINDSGLNASAVLQAPFESLGVVIVPTLIAVDGSGVVSRVWVGRPTQAQQSEVTGYLKSSAPSEAGAPDLIRTIDVKAIQHALADKRREVLIVDLDDRADYAEGHIPGARNIPLDELEIRASNELSRAAQIILYCRGGDEQRAVMAYQILTGRGFPQVSVLKGGFEEWQRAGR